MLRNYIRIRDIVKILGIKIGRTQIYRLIRDGKLKAEQRGNNSSPYFIDTFSLRDYIKSRKKAGRPKGSLNRWKNK